MRSAAIAQDRRAAATRHAQVELAVAVPVAGHDRVWELADAVADQRFGAAVAVAEEQIDLICDRRAARIREIELAVAVEVAARDRAAVRAREKLDGIAER